MRDMGDLRCEPRRGLVRSCPQRLGPFDPFDRERIVGAPCGGVCKADPWSSEEEESSTIDERGE
jgi:hypothetical protein